MKLLSKPTFLALVISIFLPQISSAQFKTETPIYMGAISTDKSKIALADSENISILIQWVINASYVIKCLDDSIDECRKMIINKVIL